MQILDQWRDGLKFGRPQKGAGSSATLQGSRVNQSTLRETRYRDYLSAEPRLNDKVVARKTRPGKLWLNALLLVSVVACYLIAGSVDADDDTDADYLGQLSANPYAADSTSNPYGKGNPYDANSVNNPYGEYGSRYSNKSANNPYATDAPKLYDEDGNYRGRLSANPYDAESTSNPYGRYGSPYSTESINNPYGAGNPYRADSPTNSYGNGIGIYDGDSDRPAEADNGDGHDAFEVVVPAWESATDDLYDFDADGYEE
jgi:hypothetical protein